MTPRESFIAALEQKTPVGVKEARQYFVNSHLKIKRRTGLSWYLFDSFYNLGFMPVNYRGLRPRTVCRALLQACKELQAGGVHFAIESFGPFGAPQHGHPSSYNSATIFACCRLGLGNDCSTVPTAAPLKDVTPQSAAGVYCALAHMAFGGPRLFEDGQRIDRVWTVAHKQALADYHAALAGLVQREIQEDGLGFLCRDATGRRRTVFNFQPRRLPLAGKVTDLTTGGALTRSDVYALEACHTCVGRL